MADNQGAVAANFAATAAPPRPPRPLADAHHVTVYRDPQWYAGWPFNGGMWQFADGELAVGFVRGRCDYDRAPTLMHRVVDAEHGEHVIARSADGGASWDAAALTTVYCRPDFDTVTRAAPVAAHDGADYDSGADGFCLIAGYGIPPHYARDNGFVVVSTDRGASWSAPVALPAHAFVEIGARPSYHRRADGTLLLFGHGRREWEHTMGPLVWASHDGGASWGLFGEIETTPREPMAIMPYPAALPDGALLIAVRRQYANRDAYTQIYRSDDLGRSWRFIARVNDFGAPASLNRLDDGRLVCVYGYRRPAFGIRARVSADDGATWGDELLLRDDGGSNDLGYPRTVVRPDGSLVTCYYFNAADDAIQQNGGVRTIQATLWRVPD